LIAISRSRTEEARTVERARIILARLEDKEIQQVAKELRVSVATVTKWCKRFSLWGEGTAGRSAIRQTGHL
jgi:transposase